MSLENLIISFCEVEGCFPPTVTPDFKGVDGVNACKQTVSRGASANTVFTPNIFFAEGSLTFANPTYAQGRSLDHPRRCPQDIQKCLSPQAEQGKNTYMVLS